MKLKLRLESKSIEKAIKELEKYRDSLAIKNAVFVQRLLDEGIKVAQEHVGGMGKYITFTSNVEGTTHCVGLLIAEDAEKIQSQWERKDGVVIAEVSPILFEEFGAGMYAKVLFPVDGVGRGTFPNQEHAFEPAWHYMDLDGKWHSSSGYMPSHPMYFADMEIINNVQKIAKEVFGNGI